MKNPDFYALAHTHYPLLREWILHNEAHRRLALKSDDLESVPLIQITLADFAAQHTNIRY